MINYKKVTGAILIIGALLSQKPVILHHLGVDTTAYRNAVVEDCLKSTVLIHDENSLGTAVVVGDGTLIITARHVVQENFEEANKAENAKVAAKGISKVFSIIDHNGKKLTATVIYLSDRSDLAILKLSGKRTAIDLGSTVETLEPVIAIGHPRGITEVTTFGDVAKIISENDADYLLHSASLDHGNSGGGLFNYEGELVGINIAITSFVRGIDSISVSITEVKRVINEVTHE